MKNKGYLTLLKENKEQNVFLNNYTYNKSIKVDDELVFDKNIFVCEYIEDTLRFMLNEEWNNLVFLNVTITGEKNEIDSDYYNSNPISTNKIKIDKILSKEDIFNDIREEINNSTPYSFSKFIKGIKLSNEENDILIKMILTNLNRDYNVLLAPIAYYQYSDKDAYKKANEKVNEPIIKISKNK